MLRYINDANKPALSHTLEHFVDAAILQAANSKLRYKHGCVIVCDGAIIGKGCNKYKIRGYMPTYVKTSNEAITTHAEISALFDVHKKGYNCRKILPRSILIVVRIPAQRCQSISVSDISISECKNSEPCHNCQKTLDKWNVGRVYHT